MLRKRILVIEEQKEIFPIIEELFEDKILYKNMYSDTNYENVRVGMAEIPDIIIINDEKHIDIYKQIVGNETGFMIPVIGISPSAKNVDVLQSIAAGINLYIVKPVDKNFLHYTIKNFINLIYNNRTISPLTKLPGNIQITNELQRRTIKRQGFYVLYVDLDNFKAYNDTYGFLKGDQVIKLAADIIVESVLKHGQKGDFVGHIRWR